MISKDKGLIVTHSEYKNRSWFKNHYGNALFSMGVDYPYILNYLFYLIKIQKGIFNML